jgi:hypothetical protein
MSLRDRDVTVELRFQILVVLDWKVRAPVHYWDVLMTSQRARAAAAKSKAAPRI